MEISIVIDDEQPLFKTAVDGYTRQKIEQEEDNINRAENSKPTLARVVRKWLVDNGWDDVIEIVNCVVSILMFLTFFVYTYYDGFNPKNAGDGVPSWLTVLETILAMLIAVDWVFGLFLSDQRITYIFSE